LHLLAIRSGDRRRCINLFLRNLHIRTSRRYLRRVFLTLIALLVTEDFGVVDRLMLLCP
jgi:hypothetical protein